MVNFSVAVSALRAAFNRQANTANNVANVSTPGFKSGRTHQQSNAAGGVDIVQVQRNFSQGPLQPTGKSLDLAVSGGGYLSVDTARGQRFTRFGSFGVNANGEIVDPGGNRLSPGFTVPNDAVSVNVARDGRISATLADGSSTNLGSVQVYSFANPGGLQAVGGGLFTPTASSGTPVAGTPGTGAYGQIVAGFIEDSNVSLARELTDQIANKATVRANIESIRAQDDMLGELLDTVR